MKGVMLMAAKYSYRAETEPYYKVINNQKLSILWNFYHYKA